MPLAPHAADQPHRRADIVSNKSIHYLIEAVQLTAPGAHTATVNSTSFDRALGVTSDLGAPYEALEVLVEFGAWTDGTHTPKLQESNDNSTWNDVAAGDQIGTLTAVSSAGGANKIQRMAYVGAKRYVRGVVTVSGATTGAIYGITAIPAFPRDLPTVASGN